MKHGLFAAEDSDGLLKKSNLKFRQTIPVKIRFLNVDLEIEHHQDLHPILESFGDDVCPLFCGRANERYSATFELKYATDVDSGISNFCLLIRSLDKEAKGLWDTAFTKVFDIGYEGGLEPRSYTSEIRVDTVEKVAALGASLRVTIYPPFQGECSS